VTTGAPTGAVHREARSDPGPGDQDCASPAAGAVEGECRACGGIGGEVARCLESGGKRRVQWSAGVVTVFGAAGDGEQSAGLLHEIRSPRASAPDRRRWMRMKLVGRVGLVDEEEQAGVGGAVRAQAAVVSEAAT
jgi:hypothetical protein